MTLKSEIKLNLYLPAAQTRGGDSGATRPHGRIGGELGRIRNLDALADGRHFHANHAIVGGGQHCDR
jgi:hypothetical protein